MHNLTLFDVYKYGLSFDILIKSLFVFDGYLPLGLLGAIVALFCWWLERKWIKKVATTEKPQE